MTVELRFSMNGTPPNTPEFREKFYGGDPTGLLSAGTATDSVATVVTNSYVAVRLEGIAKADLSSTTETDIVAAAESMAGVAHLGTVEVDE